jgi:hypothetical protein
LYTVLGKAQVKGVTFVHGFGRLLVRWACFVALTWGATLVHGFGRFVLGLTLFLGLALPFWGFDLGRNTFTWFGGTLLHSFARLDETM